jgi:hypothetical protein
MDVTPFELSLNLKALGVVALSSAAIAAGNDPYLLGIPVLSLMAAIAGALFGLAYSPPDVLGRLLSALESDERQPWKVAASVVGLFFVLSGNALASGWASEVVPKLFDVLKGVPTAPLAGLLAFSAQRLIPQALKASSKLFERGG